MGGGASGSFSLSIHLLWPGVQFCQHLLSDSHLKGKFAEAICVLVVQETSPCVCVCACACACVCVSDLF